MAALPASSAIWSALPLPAVLIENRDGIETIVDANPAFELFVSASATILKGVPLRTRLTGDGQLVDSIVRAREQGSPVFINDLPVRGRDGARTQCTVQIAPMGETGDLVLVLVSPQEIAGRLGRTKAVKAAAKSAIGMSEMLAHEIKNPLAGIAGAAQLLSMGLNDEDRALTDLIVAETRRIVKLLEQVEQFGDQRAPDLHPVNLHDVLERAKRLAELGFGSHMRLIDDYDPSLPEALIDQDQVLQVFQNLFKNAAQAQPNGGTIRIRTYFERGLQIRAKDGVSTSLPLHVEVIDDGPGLPPAIADNVFEPFVSGRENGTGLGLALVSKIIAAHNGWIEVESAPGKTVFRVSLPMAPSPNARPKPKKEVR